MAQNQFIQTSGSTPVSYFGAKSGRTGDSLMNAGRMLLMFVMFVMATLMLVSGIAHAADDDSDDDGARATHAAAGERNLRRQYVGGRDEEELTVQAALPQPVRSPDAVPGSPEANSGSHD